MKLPNAPLGYNQTNEQQTRSQIEREDGRTLKKGQDIIIVTERIVLTASDGSQWSLTVNPAGAISTTAYP